MLNNEFVRLTCTDHRIIEILGLRPSNRLPVSYYFGNYLHKQDMCNYLKNIKVHIEHYTLQYNSSNNFDDIDI
jgi:hypothetical protein